MKAHRYRRETKLDFSAHGGSKTLARSPDPFAKVGSFSSPRENFRLTAGAKETFTKKLHSEAREFFGRKVEELVRNYALKLIMRWSLGLEAIGNRGSSIQQPRMGRNCKS